MAISAPVDGYSAQVHLELRVAGRQFRLSQVGGGRIVLKEAAILPGTSGEVIAHIDHHEQRSTATFEASDAPRKIVPVVLTPIRPI